jgi:leader peptidase (prepilin peptidase) / N-methyltransferase
VTADGAHPGIWDIPNTHEREVERTVTVPDVLIAGAGALAGAVGGGCANLVVERSRHLPVAAWILTPLLGVVLGLGVVLRVSPAPLAAAGLVLLAAGLPLSAIDATTRKLPDRLLLPAIPICATFLALTAVCAGDYGPFWRALAAAAAVFLAFTALALAAPGQLGFGDCKAAALGVLPLGYLGWSRVLLGILAAYLLAALYLVGRRFADTPTANTIAFGPYLFAGPLIVLLLK